MKLLSSVFRTGQRLQGQNNRGLLRLHSTFSSKRTFSKIDIHVESEISILQKVLTHRPNIGHGRIAPKDAEELLFDDIVYLPLMQKEHDILTNVLKAFMGAENVIEVRDLVVEVLNLVPKSRAELVEKVGKFDNFNSEVYKKLATLNNSQLIDTLISGYSKKHQQDLIGPMPNYIFTRDIAVAVNKHILLTKPAKKARMRQQFLTAAIFKYHPYFTDIVKNNLLIDLSNQQEFPTSKNGDLVLIQGGDVMIIHKDYLLVGHGQRTTEHAFQQLCTALFKRKVIKNVVQINIPSDRSCMHIDTLFTQINTNHVVAYQPTVIDGIGSNVIVHRDSGETKEYQSIASFMKAEINPNMEFILSGNGKSPFQEREQWTDGCNLVALRPGVALTYDRNTETEMALWEAGYQTIDAVKLLKMIRLGRIRPQEIEDTIIKLPSTELSRGRGGSHCMTCPLQRR